jgi:hypothetical protein
MFQTYWSSNSHRGEYKDYCLLAYMPPFLAFYPENGRSRFLQNTAICLSGYAALLLV